MSLWEALVSSGIRRCRNLNDQNIRRSRNLDFGFHFSVWYPLLNMVSALKFLVFNILVQDFSPKLGLAFLQDLVFLQDLAFLQDLELLFFKRASRPTHEQPPPAVRVHQNATI